MRMSLGGVAPSVHETAFVAPSADLVGDVVVGARSSVWFGAVLRADRNRIVVGEETNVQDGAVVHCDPPTPVAIGSRVTIGHGARLHGCTVEDHCLVGIGAVVLDGARIGHHTLVAAGALVPVHTVVPPYSLVLGAPAKVVSNLGEDKLALMEDAASTYVELAQRFLAEGSHG